MPERSLDNKENRKIQSEYDSNSPDNNNQRNISCEPNQQEIVASTNNKHVESSYLSYRVSRPMRYVAIESRQLMMIIR